MPISNRQQLTSTLVEFYHQPVAQVSLQLLLSILAVIFFAVFAIKPTLVTMSDLIKELEEKRELDLKLSQKIASLASVQSQYQAAQGQIQVLDEALPSSPEMIKTLKIIEKTASDNQLAITSISISEIPVSTPVFTGASIGSAKLNRISYPISITVEGDYQTIKDFVEQLQDSRRVLAAESVAFNLVDKQGNQSLHATITVSAPYFGK